MDVVYRQEASEDIADAFRWYEAQSVGLGREFERAVHAVAILIETFPAAFPVVFRDLRRAVTVRFPYLIYYRQWDPETLEIVACLHTGRDADVIRRRVGDA